MSIGSLSSHYSHSLLARTLRRVKPHVLQDTIYTLKEKSKITETLPPSEEHGCNTEKRRSPTQNRHTLTAFTGHTPKLPKSRTLHRPTTKYATLAITTSRKNLSTGPISYCPSRQPPLKAQISNLSSNPKLPPQRPT